MNKFRKGIIVFAILIITGHVILIKYTGLSWLNNAGSYLGIVAMILIVISVIFSSRKEKVNKAYNQKVDEKL